VFYRFTVAAPVDTRLTLEELAGFGGTMGLFQLPGGTCPAAADGLVPVAIAGGADACTDFSSTVINAAGLPAGEYLVVVENGFFDAEGGLFRVTMEQFADGFPPFASCADDVRLTATLPAAVGQSTTIEFTAAEFQPDSVSDWGVCSARGGEIVYELTSTVAQTVVFETDAAADTVLALVEGRCVAESVVGCDDDGADTGLNSLLEADLEANVTYFLVVDLFSAESTDGSVIITRQ
jgi:hypothetical protein